MSRPRKSPCMGCERRHPHCHSDCEAYATWCRAREAQAEARRQQEQGARDADAVLVRTSRQIKQTIRRVQKFGGGGNEYL